MSGRSRRDAEATVTRIGSDNVFAALEALRKKKKKPASSSSASGRKGRESRTKTAAAPVLWAPAPLKSKAWADVDDDAYFAAAAPLLGNRRRRPAAGDGDAGAVEESESEDDDLDVDIGDDEPEEKPGHEPVVDVPSELEVKKSGPIPAQSKETERQLSKKELKKELAQLDAVNLKER